MKDYINYHHITTRSLEEAIQNKKRLENKEFTVSDITIGKDSIGNYIKLYYFKIS